MWLETYGEALVNLDNVSMIDTTTPTHDGGPWHVEAWFVGEDVSKTLWVGTSEECIEYKNKIKRMLRAKSLKTEVYKLMEKHFPSLTYYMRYMRSD